MSPVVPIPHLTADEIQVLLHGLARLAPTNNKQHLDTFGGSELRAIVASLSTALLEALATVRQQEQP